jgi:hypothetical protein
MRKVLVVCAMLIFASAAWAQVRVESGWGSTAGWGGYYPPTPFVPMVSTPGVSFNTYSANSVGASNATEGLVAGARNSTLSMSYPSTLNAYTVPVWTNENTGPAFPVIEHREIHAVMHEGMMHEGMMHDGMMREHMAHSEPMISFGSATMGMGHDVAERVKGSQANRQPAKRTYTNQDIERIQQQKGTVKFNGKTETIG